MGVMDATMRKWLIANGELVEMVVESHLAETLLSPRNCLLNYEIPHTKHTNSGVSHPQ
jgi:hypothetical protein